MGEGSVPFGWRNISKPRGSPDYPHRESLAYQRGWMKAIGEIYKEHKPRRGTYKPRMAATQHKKASPK